jgi:hypothetical protein
VDRREHAAHSPADTRDVLGLSGSTRDLRIRRVVPRERGYKPTRVCGRGRRWGLVLGGQWGGTRVGRCPSKLPWLQHPPQAAVSN